MTFTHNQFMTVGIALVFLVIAIAEFFGSRGSKTIDIIVGIVAFVLFAWIVLSKVGPLFHWF